VAHKDGSPNGVLTRTKSMYQRGRDRFTIPHESARHLALIPLG
jgi:hypothetical protein